MLVTMEGGGVGLWGRSNLPQKFNSPFWTKLWTVPAQERIAVKEQIIFVAWQKIVGQASTCSWQHLCSLVTVEKSLVGEKNCLH